MSTTGRLEERGIAFEWKLEKFSSLHDISYCSPDFHFGGRRWYLRLYPHFDESDHLVGLELWMKHGQPPLQVRYSVGIAKAGGGTEVWGRGNTSSCHVFVPGTKRSEVFRRREELLPGDLLTVTVTMRAEAERDVADTSVQATVESHVTDASDQTTVEEIAASGDEGEPSADADFEKLREHFRLWLEHPEEGERIRRLRMEELEKREKVVKKQPPPEKGPIFYAA